MTIEKWIILHLFLGNYHVFRQNHLDWKQTVARVAQIRHDLAAQHVEMI